LNRNNGETIAANDNGGGGPSGKDVQITQTLSGSSVFVIIATPFAPNATGAYTLSLTRAAGLGAEAQAEANPQRPGRVAMLKRIMPASEEVNLDSRFDRLTSRRVVTQ